MIGFWILAAVLIASAVWTIAGQKPVYSVVALLLNFATLAIFYVTLSAEFLAVIQIIVYSGAILVLFVFVIALLSSGVAPFAMGPNRLPRIAVPAGCSDAGGIRLSDLCRQPRHHDGDAVAGRTSAPPTRSAASRTSAKRSLPYNCCPLKLPRWCLWSR